MTRVLVVEDSVPNRRLLQKLLSRMGCVTSAAEDGEECLRYFSQVPEGQPPPFDLVLMVRKTTRTHVRQQPAANRCDSALPALRSLVCASSLSLLPCPLPPFPSRRTTRCP